MNKDIEEKLSWAEDILKEFKYARGHAAVYEFLSYELAMNPDSIVREKCIELMVWAKEHGVV